MHSCLTYDVSRAHRRGRGDKPKNDIFLLVTTRLIAHSGQSQFKSTYTLLYVVYWHFGEFLIDIKMHLFVIRRTVLGPGVCLCIRI